MIGYTFARHNLKKQYWLRLSDWYKWLFSGRGRCAQEVCDSSVWSGLVSRLQRQLGGSRRGERHHQDHHDDHHDYNQDHRDDQDQDHHGHKDDDHQHEQVMPLAWRLGVNEAKGALLMESSCLSHLHQKFNRRTELLLMWPLINLNNPSLSDPLMEQSQSLFLFVPHSQAGSTNLLDNHRSFALRKAQKHYWVTFSFLSCVIYGSWAYEPLTYG